MGDVPADITGLYQYIIGGLSIAVTTLGGVVGLLWKNYNDVNKARLTERDVLNATVNSAVTALKEVAETSRRRADVNEKFGELMNQITSALKLLTERLNIQHEHSNRDLADSIIAVKALAASVTQLNTSLAIGVTEIKSEIRANA